jgi:molecular chaperone GrpE
MKHNAEHPQPAEQPGPLDPTAPEGSGGAASPPRGGALIEPPEEAVVRVEGELAALKDKYLRLAAEYDNFRKRAAKERAEVWGKAQADVVQRLVDALDDLARFAHVDPTQADVRTIHDGVELVERKLWKELETLGVTRVDQVGVPFDPNLHEAVATQPADDPAKDHTVGAVLQPGYRLGGTLLRPARVVVLTWAGAGAGAGGRETREE